jgi:tellurite resistance protein TerC
MAELTYRAARRIVILIIGSTVMLLGVAMLVLPGPGMLAIALGLGILGIEFAFARRLLKKTKDTAAAIRDSVLD